MESTLFLSITHFILALVFWVSDFFALYTVLHIVVFCWNILGEKACQNLSKNVISQSGSLTFRQRLSHKHLSECQRRALSKIHKAILQEFNYIFSFAQTEPKGISSHKFIKTKASQKENRLQRQLIFHHLFSFHPTSKHQEKGIHISTHQYISEPGFVSHKHVFNFLLVCITISSQPVQQIQSIGGQSPCCSGWVTQDLMVNFFHFPYNFYRYLIYWINFVLSVPWYRRI